MIRKSYLPSEDGTSVVVNLGFDLELIDPQKSHTDGVKATGGVAFITQSYDGENGGNKPSHKKHLYYSLDFTVPGKSIASLLSKPKSTDTLIRVDMSGIFLESGAVYVSHYSQAKNAILDRKQGPLTEYPNGFGNYLTVHDQDANAFVSVMHLSDDGEVSQTDFVGLVGLTGANYVNRAWFAGG